MLSTTYHVKLTFTEPLLGTVPKDEKVYTNYLADRAAKRIEDGDTISADTALELIEEETATVPNDEQRGWTGFHTDADGAFLYDYQVKGFLKEAANLSKDFPEIKITALRSKVDNYCYVFPRRIRLSAVDPEPLERPLRAMTMQGPRVSLVRSDTVSAGVSIEFDIKMLAHKDLNAKLLGFLLDFGEFKGLGQWRNGGFGRFTYSITEA